MAYVVAIAVVAMVTMLMIALWGKDKDSLEQLKDAWPFALAILGRPLALLRAYFGMRTQAKKARYAAATGQQIAGFMGAIAGLLKR